MEIPNYGVVVVGAGAAGLSAALVLGRARRRVAVVDAGAPRNAPAAHMQGFLSRDGMSPADFLAAGRVEVTGYGVELIEEQVVAIDDGFDVRLSCGSVLTGNVTDPRAQVITAAGAGSAAAIAINAALVQADVDRVPSRDLLELPKQGAALGGVEALER